MVLCSCFKLSFRLQLGQVSELLANAGLFCIFAEVCKLLGNIQNFNRYADLVQNVSITTFDFGLMLFLDTT
jgi:hypothetical protein